MLRPKFHHKAHMHCTKIILCQKKKTKYIKINLIVLHDHRNIYSLYHRHLKWDRNTEAN
jgi:hypothetical protein